MANVYFEFLIILNFLMPTRFHTIVLLFLFYFVRYFVFKRVDEIVVLAFVVIHSDLNDSDEWVVVPEAQWQPVLTQVVGYFHFGALLEI